MKNTVILIGNAGKNVEIKQFESGRELATLSIATSSKYKDKLNEIVKVTQWHRVTVWNPNKIVSSIKKGDVVYVEGSIEYRTYTENDVAKTITEIKASSVLNFSMTKDEQNALGEIDGSVLDNNQEFDDLPF